MKKWIEKALELCFSQASELDVTTLNPRQDVRDMCRADRCRAYGKNWTCPPFCGSLEQCREKIAKYDRGILLQTVGKTQKRIDTRAYKRAEQLHLEQFHRFAEEVRKEMPEALCLGSGGCRICPECAWPDPCRFPERACSSMESYGLLVSRVCSENGLAYHHGDFTVTYTSCVLFSGFSQTDD